jgi:F420-non-reducing hydrogenase iron-sulfur subunit
MSDFEPRIVVFCCNWCAYAGADLAGVSRVQYTTNSRIIRIMCTGRIEIQFILRAFELGADGVLVAGCHIGECHYIAGNESAVRQMDITWELLDTLGIDKKRLRLEWVSACECSKFADIMNGFKETLIELGPNPLTEGSN